MVIFAYTWCTYVYYENVFPIILDKSVNKR